MRGLSRLANVLRRSQIMLLSSLCASYWYHNLIFLYSYLHIHVMKAFLWQEAVCVMFVVLSRSAIFMWFLHRSWSSARNAGFMDWWAGLSLVVKCINHFSARATQRKDDALLISVGLFDRSTSLSWWSWYSLLIHRSNIGIFLEITYQVWIWIHRDECAQTSWLLLIAV